MRRISQKNCNNSLDTLPDWIQGDILKDLKNIMESFDDYFPPDIKKKTKSFQF
jgi:hypothetical protein